MALPSTPVNASVANGHCAPFISSAGNVYVATIATDGDVAVFKTTDPATAAWIQQDDTNGPTNPATIISGEQIDNVIKLATFDTGSYYYYEFNMTTDLWVVVDELIVTPSPTPAYPWIALTITEYSGISVITYSSAPEEVSGSSYERIMLRLRESGTWSAEKDIGEAAGLEEHYLNPVPSPVDSQSGTTMRDYVFIEFGLALGSSTPTEYTDWGHCTYNYLGGNFVSRVSNEGSIATSTINTRQHAVLWTSPEAAQLTLTFYPSRSGNTTGNIVGGGRRYLKDNIFYTPAEADPYGVAFTSVNEPPLEHENHSILTVASEGVTENFHALWSNSDDSNDIWYSVSDDLGESWSTPVEELNNVNCTAISAVVYNRSFYTVLAYIYEDAGIIKYNEKILATREATPTGIQSEESFINPIVYHDIGVFGTPSAEAFGSLTASPFRLIIPQTIESEEAFGSANIETGLIHPLGIASEEAIGSLIVTPEGLVVTPASIPSDEAFGTPTATPGTSYLTPTSIQSEEDFGFAIVKREPVPSTIVSLSLWEGHHPPCLSSAGNVYAVAKKTGGTNVSIYKTTDPVDPLTTWIEQTTGSPTNAATVVSVYQGGDIVHIATYSAGICYYHQFNMSTDTWDVIDEVIENIDNVPYYPSIQITARSDGDVIVVYAGDTDKVAGNVKERVDLNIRTAGTWSGPISLGTVTTEHYGNPTCVKDSITDDIYIFYERTANPANPPTGWATPSAARILDSSDTLGAQSSISTQFRAGMLSSKNSISLDDNGTKRMITQIADVSLRTEVSGGSIIASGGLFIPVNPPKQIGEVRIVSATMLPSNEFCVLVSDISHSDNIWHSITINNRTSFFYSELLSNVTCNDVSVTYYKRGNYGVIAYLFDDAGITKYFEKIIDPPIEAYGIPSEEAFGSPIISSPVTPTGILSAEAFGSHSVSSVVNPISITSEEAFGSATIVIDTGTDLYPIGIISGEVVSTGAVLTSKAYITPIGFTSAAIGYHTLDTERNAIVTRISTSLFGSLSVLPIEAIAPAEERLMWKTEVQITHNGTEVRNRTRANPRQELKYSIIETSQRLAESVITEYSGLNLNWLIPLWIENKKTGNINANDTIITTSTVNYDYRDKSLALIYESVLKWEVVEIDTVSTGSLNLLYPVKHDYINPSIMPSRVGIIKDNIIKEHTGYSSKTRITFAVTDNLALPEPDLAQQFLGDDIYFDDLLGPDTNKTVKKDFYSRIDKVDFELGIFDQSSPWLFNRVSLPARSVNQGIEDIRIFKRFLERRGGKFKQFWQPTFESDLKNTSSGTITTILSVDAIGQKNWNIERTHIAILDKSGNWHPRTITNFNQINTTTMELTLDTALNLESYNVLLISYLSLNRLETDLIEIKWVGNNTIVSNINLVEIKA